ncbi:MAG: phage portal protein, partial [Hydrogenophaga sp.]
AFFTVLIETESGNTAPVFDGAPQGGGSAPGASDEIGLGMGAVLGLAKGEKATFADPKRPNPNAEGFIHMLVGLIGMGLGIPREVLLKQFNASYSASKAALLDAWVHFRSERFWAGLSFCQPILETWMAAALFIGRIKARGFFSDPLMRWAYTRAAWPGDSMGSINPKDEVAAYTAAIDARLMTRERAEWELGGTDWNATFDQKLAEHQRLLKNNLLPVPKAGAAAPQAQPTGAPTEPEENDDDPA